MAFPDLLKTLRKGTRLTQNELAQRAACSLTLIQKLESGSRRPSRQLAEMLAAALELTGEGRAHFLREARQSHLTGPGSSPSESLPLPLTPLIGREREVEWLLQRLMSGARLTTLVGPPGVGKTRLALEIAHLMAASDESEAAVHFLSLVSVEQPSDLLPALMAGLNIAERNQSEPAATLVRGLRNRQLLLILDNFEQLLDAQPATNSDVGAAKDVSLLLAACPSLQLVITSRIPLRLRGEQLLRVQPFAAPQPATIPAAQLRHYPAIRLFVERVQNYDDQFALTRDNGEEICSVCHLLDGLPLAIELAAAQLRHLSLTQLHTQLQRSSDHFFSVLSDRTVDLPVRHRSLRTAIEWSVGRLSGEQQQLFARLGLFSGDFDLRAVEATCIDLFSPAVTALHLRELVDQSLLVVKVGGAEHRYALLETLREYALEQLARRGDEATARRRLTDFLLSDARRGHPLYDPLPDEEEWRRRNLSHFDTLRSSLHGLQAHLPPTHESSGETGGDDALHELCGLTGHLFYTLGHFREGSTFLYRSLSLLPTGHPHRVRILQALSMILEGQAHYGEAELFVREARSEAARLEMVADEIVALYNLSHIQVKLGDYAGGRATLTAGLVLCERLGAEDLTRILTGAMAQNYHETGNLEEALHWYAKARALLAQRPFDGIVAGTNAALAELEVARRDGPAALQLVQPSCDYYEQNGQMPALAWALRNRGLAWLAAGQPRQAAKSLLRAWSLYSELGSQDGLVIAAEGMALVAAALGAGPDAGRLWGSAQRRRREIDLPLSPMSRLSHHWLLLPAQEQLGEQAWALALQSGERLTEADVAALVAVVAQKTGV